MGRATANPSPNNPNTYGQPPPSPPQFQPPPPQYYHQEQVIADQDSPQASHEVPPPSYETYTDDHEHDHDDEDHSHLEMVPYDDLSQPEPAQPQIATQPPQQAYPPNPPPQKPQPNAFQTPQQNAFQGNYPPQGKQQPQPYPQPHNAQGPYPPPPQGKQQPQAYPPPPNAQGPVQFPPPQPQEPVQFPPQMNNHQATHTPQHPMNGMAGIPPSPYKANVQVGVPMHVGTEAWSSDLFSCMNDPESAILTAFCPCMTFGQIAEITDNGQTSCATSGSLYGLVALTLMPCLIASPYRQKLRTRYNLIESPLPDWLAHWIFPWCALCQEYRELQHRGFEPSIGWDGNVARAQMMQHQQQSGMAPPVNQAMSGL